MSKPLGLVQVRVDEANPGQFFACCGLLELAERLWGGAEACFDDGIFRLHSRGSLEELLVALVKETAKEITRLDNGIEVKPLIAPLQLTLDEHPTVRMVLDAWMQVRREKGEIVAAANPPWNFWSGQQTSLRIWTALREALTLQMRLVPSVFGAAVFDLRVLTSGRFGFDPGAAWNALDVGFSPNEQGLAVASSPAVEMLAAVGVQRFRPRLSERRDSFVYSTWGKALPPSIAAACASDTIRVPSSKRFLCRVASRGSYAALSQSTMLGGEDHE
jgi:CRISPR-associated protein Csb3